MRDKDNNFEYFMITLIAVALAFLLDGFIVQRLWNELVPQIFGITPITYWQGVCLVLLTHSLFPGGNKSKNK